MILFPEGWPFVIHVEKEDITPKDWTAIPLD